jgi:hypothetical protein
MLTTVETKEGEVKFGAAIKYSLFLLLLMACCSFAGDYDSMTSEVVSDLEGIKTTLMSIGGVIIGFGVIYAIVKFVRRFL